MGVLDREYSNGLFHRVYSANIGLCIVESVYCIRYIPTGVLHWVYSKGCIQLDIFERVYWIMYIQAGVLDWVYSGVLELVYWIEYIRLGALDRA
jgi:hypothetical protein